MKNKRLTELDLLRIFGFIMVVAQHILGSYAGRPETDPVAALIFHAAYLFGRPAVPLFVALTGFTLFNSHFQKGLNPKDFFRKKSIQILIPYLFWSFFYMLYYHKTNRLMALVPVLMSGQGSYHLWYLVMLTRLLILFPFVFFGTRWVLEKKSRWAGSLVAVGMLLFLVLNIKNGLITASLKDWFITSGDGFYFERYLNYSPLYYSGYFMMGALLYFKRGECEKFAQKYSGWILLIYIPISAYMYTLQAKKVLPVWAQSAQNSHILKVLFMMLTILLLYRVSLAFRSTAEKWGQGIGQLGALSFGAYLVHVWMLNEFSKHYLSVFSAGKNVLSGVSIFLFTIISSFVVAFAINKIPLLNYTIGMGKPIIRKKQMLQKV